MLTDIKKRPLCFACLLFLLIVYIAGQGVSDKVLLPYESLQDLTVTACGTVRDREEKDGMLTVYLKDVTFERGDAPNKAKGIVVKLTGSPRAAKAARIGAALRVKGVFSMFDPGRCEGSFDARSYYLIKGYQGRLDRARIIGASKDHDRISEALRGLRQRAYGILSDNMSAEDASLAAAMTLGVKSGLDTEVKELYQNAGISHVLALSGLHIASVGLAVLSALKRLGIRGPIAGMATLILMLAYAAMTGMSTSTVRAVIMFALFVFKEVFNRTYDLLSAAAFAALVMIISNPLLTNDTGFLLSFGAVVAIAVVYPMLIRIPSDLFAKREGKEPGRIYKSVCVSLAVMITTLPVMGKSFMQISLFSLAINIVVIPLMSVVLLTTFAGMIVGFLGPDPGYILKITHYILRFYDLICKLSEKIDGNIMLIGSPGKIQTITYAVILIFAVTVRIFGELDNRVTANGIDRTGRSDSKNNVSDPKIGLHKITYIIENSSDRDAQRRKKIITTCVSLALIIAAPPVLLTRSRSDLEIRNIDVGQGDCAVIWGRDTATVMIDAGSSDIRSAGKYRVLPVLKANRVNTVDLCFLTHLDSDHISAVTEMLEEEPYVVSIKRIYINKTAKSLADSTKNYDRLEAAAKKRGCKIGFVAAGDGFDLGKVRISVLSPSDSGDLSYADANDASTVLLLSYKEDERESGFNALFTGDMGEGAERQIKNSMDKVLYLKVAHHGSRFSSSDDFIGRISPKIAVISAGVGNSYGHPHKETLDMLARVNSRIFRTDEGGEIILKLDQDTVSVERFLDSR